MYNNLINPNLNGECQVCLVYLSDTCVQWPDTSCSHMTPTEHTVLRSGRGTHMALLKDDEPTTTPEQLPEKNLLNEPD